MPFPSLCSSLLTIDTIGLILKNGTLVSKIYLIYFLSLIGQFRFLGFTI